jgi:hypothetical protein
MRPLLWFLLLSPADFAQDPPPGFPRPAAANVLRLAEIDIGRRVDDGLAEERRLYWLKCSLALKARRDSRGYALRGLGLFLATVPLEYTISRHRHIRHAEPVALNAAAFVLMGATLFQLSRSYRHWEEYERDRNCCRIWQEYARPTTAKVAAADPPWGGPSRPFYSAQRVGDAY